MLKNLTILFKNLDTISFIELLTENKKLIIRGYEKNIISEKINTFFALPFFLALMTVLAAIFTMNNKKFKQYKLFNDCCSYMCNHLLHERFIYSIRKI